MSNWGQGAKNNDIGWGQGASNNNINWGASHFVSHSGETNITGLEGVLTLAFETRVLADGGVFEAKQCLRNNLTELI